MNPVWMKDAGVWPKRNSAQVVLKIVVSQDHGSVPSNH